MSQWVLTDRIGRVATLTLNRPGRHNSLIPELLEALLAALKSIERDARLGAVALQANGRSFSTGGDLLGFYEEMGNLQAYASQIVGRLNQVILALVELPVPVVAAVHGIVTGGSLGLVMSCDVVLVAPEASFTPYYNVVGFSPDGGWTAMLPEVIGAKRAAEVLLRNLTISAEQATAWGLASRVVPAGRIREEALAVAQEIAAKKPGSVGHIKHLLNQAHGDPSPGSGQGLAARLEAERARFVEQIGTEEARRGIVDFLRERHK